MLACEVSRLVAILVVAVMFAIFSEVCESHVISTVKPFTVFVACLGGNRRLTKFSLLVHVVGTLIGEVPSCCFDAVMEASALDVAELLGRRIPRTAVMVRWRARLGHVLASHDLLRMSEGQVVTPAKTIPVVVADIVGDGRTTEFLVHLRIGRVLKSNVLAGSFNAIVEALPLYVAQLLWRGVPSAAALIRAVLGRPVLGGKECGRAQRKSKRCECNSRELHRRIPPCRSCTLDEMVSPMAALSQG
jgi:hypothetical protein